MSYPYGQGQGYGGYPQQGEQPGYPQGGYPAQQPGYPQPQPGYPQPQTGYPQPGGYGVPQGGMAMPTPDYGQFGAGTYPGGTAYPAQPPPIGFSGAEPPSVAMPAPMGIPQPGYGTGGYPGAASQPGYPGAQQPQPGQPPYGGAQPTYGAGQPAYGVGQLQPGQPQNAQPSYGGGQPGYVAPHDLQGSSMYPQLSTDSQPTVPVAAPRAPARPSYSPQPPTRAMAGMTIKTRKESGTVRPAPGFDPENDCKLLRKAMKGFGTDEKAIIDILCYRSNDQRLQLLVLFKTMFGKDLISNLKSELGGNFEDVVVALMTPTADYDAQQLYKAIKGLGTDEDCLIEVMCTRNNKQMRETVAAYKRLYKRNLEDDLRGDTSGYFQRLMVAMSTGGRMEGQPLDQAKAKKDAQALYAAGERRLGTDESAFTSILASQSYEQLQLVFKEYHQISKKSIEASIRSEMSGDLCTGMLTIVKCVMNRPGYFAEKLYKSMKGAGTDDRALIRVVVTRCEVDMVQIKEHFQQIYGKTLESFIQGDCSGDYKRALLALVKNK